MPGDVSSAAFWIALAAGTPGAEIEIDGVGLNPSRTAIFDVARRAGARIDVSATNVGAGEPTGRIRVAYGTPASFEIRPDEVPGLIDEIPALAALGAMLPDGAEMRVSGAAELRVKESDRISCLAAGLRAMGAAIDEFPDGFRLAGPAAHRRHRGCRRRSPPGDGVRARRRLGRRRRPRCSARLLSTSRIRDSSRRSSR